MNSRKSKQVITDRASERPIVLHRWASSPTWFVIINILSFSMYSLYWGWQLWETVRLQKGTRYRFRSTMRSLFLVVSAFWLFSDIEKVSQKKKLKKWAISGRALAAGYLVCYFAVGVVSFLLPAAFAPQMSFLLIASLLEAVVLLPIVYKLRELSKADSTFTPPRKENEILILVIASLYVLVLFSIGSYS